MTLFRVIAADDRGATVDDQGNDAEALADKWAAAAQQEADCWPEFGLVYMLVAEEEAACQPK